MDSAHFSTLMFSTAEMLVRRNISSKAKLLEQWAKEDPATRENRIRNSLFSTLEYASAKVPYYHDLFQRIRFQPSRILKDHRYFDDIPYLTKDIVQNSYDQLISNDFDRSELIVRKTSGSSGITTPFLYSAEELDWTAASTVFLNKSIGRSIAKREVHLSSRPLQNPPLSDRLMETFKCLALNRTNVQLNYVSESEAERAWNELCTAKPYMIYGLPSLFRTLLLLRPPRAKQSKSCKYFVSSGETLDAATIRLIANEGLQIINRYGNAEFGAVAQSHDVPTEVQFLEGIVYPEHLSLQAGMNEVVLTTLLNRAMPLIRYRTGDLGTVSNTEKGNFRLTEILGRVHEVVDFGETKFMTSFFRDFLHSNFSIHDFQIIQSNISTTFNIVTDQPDSLEKIAEALRNVTKSKIQVKRIRLTDLIRRGQLNKLSYLIRSSDEHPSNQLPN